MIKRVFFDAVMISPEKLQAVHSKWKSALIGKFLGRRMDSDFIAKAISFKWKLVSDLEIIPLLGSLMMMIDNGS